MSRNFAFVVGLCVLVTVGGLCAWWLLQSGERPGVHVPSGDHNEPNQRAAVPDSLNRDADAPQPDGANEEVSKPEGTDAESDERPAGGPQADPEAPIVPSFGPALERGGAHARFELVDAMNQPLAHAGVRVELHRRVGSRWIEDHAWFETDGNIIVCSGRSGEGLEPGGYELEVSADEYGALRHRFSVGKGQRIESVLQTPHYRRVISFRFVDTEGNPIQWIDNPPSVHSRADGLKHVQRPGHPGKVLRAPPQPSAAGGMGGSSGGGGFTYRTSPRVASIWKTDDGTVYAHAIAGAHNVVSFGFDETVWGVDKHTFEGRFIDGDWDGREVVLHLSDAYTKAVEEHQRKGEDDPGQRSLVQWRERLSNRPRVTDPADIRPGKGRLLIELDAPEGIVPVYSLSQDVEDLLLDADSPELHMSRRDGLWYSDGKRGETITYMFTDNRTWHSETFKATLDEKVTRVRHAFDAQEATLPPWQLPPTLDAWAARRELQIKLQAGEDGFDHEIMRLDYDRGRYFVPTVSQRPSGAWLQWRLGSPRSMLGRRIDDTRIDDAYYTGASWLRQHTGWGWTWTYVDFAEAGTEELQDRLARGDFAPPEIEDGLAFRVIGPAGEGLPWVEGSVVKYSDDAICRRLQEVERALSRDNNRPLLQSDFADEYYENEDGYRPETIDPDVMKRHVGEPFLEHTTERDDLAWYARHGAWYNTHRKVSSDLYGYSISWTSLEPGELYVMYLWSQSRNDLQPDMRIVFRATEGLTDLGAITMPTYSE